MSRSWKMTLVASLAGSVAGVSISMFHLGDYIWRGHAGLTELLMTLAVSIGVLIFWPKESEGQPQRG
jgi:hypothetical protein